MKVSIFDKQLIRGFYAILSVVSVITSLLLIFIEIPSESKVIIGIVAVSILILIYVFEWIRSNKKQSIELSIASSPVEIKYGDLFEEDGLKVIAFNEYFDTKVDERIIASGSMNGYFINNKVSNVGEYSEHD